MGLSNQDATAIVTDNGIRTQYGLILPPGARVAAYVRSTGFQSGDDAFLAANLVSTLAAGLARVRAGLGDFVVVLPGHAENVVDGTAFSNALLAGTKIVGVGKGSNAPTFTWTATASSWVVGVADVQISGLKLLLDGINAVVSAISVTAANFGFLYNEVEVSTTAKAPTVCMTLAAGATNAKILGNVFTGVVPTAVAGDGILISGAASNVTIEENDMTFPVTAASGHIRIAAAALGLKIRFNTLYNTAAASTAGVSFGAFAADGVVANNNIATLSTGAATTGVIVGATALVRLFQNFVSGVSRSTGILTGTAST